MKKADYRIKVQAQPVALFETPVAYATVTQAEDLSRDLLAAIELRRSQTPGIKRSNEGGWHSDTEMLQWGGAAAQKLADTAISVAKKMSHFEGAGVEDFDWQANMWANVTEAGGLNSLHAHPGNLWAAVYYLDLGRQADGEPDSGGNFYLEDPRFPLAAMHNPGFRLLDGQGRPQQVQTQLKLSEGNMIVFPAWLRHGVQVYRGGKQRISIAINIDAKPR